MNELAPHFNDFMTFSMDITAPAINSNLVFDSYNMAFNIKYDIWLDDNVYDEVNLNELLMWENIDHDF
jgi:hypothetical protein